MKLLAGALFTEVAKCEILVCFREKIEIEKTTKIIHAYDVCNAHAKFHPERQ